MAEDELLWDLDSHTVGKHLVLRAYLNAWLPIMSLSNRRVVFIDGFAGPGQYRGGEPGSPVIALQTLIEHQYVKQLTQDIHYIFVEKDPARLTHLKQRVAVLFPHLPKNIKLTFVQGAFDDTLNNVLSELDAQNKTLAPCFVMADPFGVSQTPFSTVSRILANSKSEIMLSFMYSYINRFKEHNDFAPHLDALFGASGWREGIAITDSVERRRFFQHFYRAQLKSIGGVYVHSFDLFRGNEFVYTLFLATKSLTGSQKMKEAIWKVDRSGGYTFRASDGQQFEIGLEQPNFSILRKQLLQKFGDGNHYTIESIEAFMQSDETPFHENHLRKHALTELEKQGLLIVEGERARAFTYPSGKQLRLRFTDLK